MNIDNILNDDYFKIQDELKEVHLEIKKLNEEAKAYLNNLNNKKQILKDQAEKLLSQINLKHNQ
jgi:uncharacterized protein YpuA (DUF1002 family)